MFKVGDWVRVLKDTSRGSYWMRGDVFQVTALTDDMIHGKRSDKTYTNYVEKEDVELLDNPPTPAPTNKEETMEMSKTITDVYEKTEDAVVVNKYFRSLICDNAFYTELLKLVKKPILDKALEMEEAENKK